MRPTSSSNDRTAARASETRIYYTTEGSVRGSCGHRHQSARTARECLRRDQRGCQAQGGYSDRRVVRVVGA